MAFSCNFDHSLHHLIDSELKGDETEASRDSPFSPHARINTCISHSSHLLGDSFLDFQRQLAQLENSIQAINRSKKGSILQYNESERKQGHRPEKIRTIVLKYNGM